MHGRDGFFGSLFDGSFMPYAVSRRVKAVYALWLALTTVVCAAIVVDGFIRSASVGVTSLAVVAPLFFVVSLVCGRVFIKVVLAARGLVATAPASAEARVCSGAPLPR